MGLGNLQTKTAGQIIDANDPNQYKQALSVDQVPRNVSGVPTANAGTLGTSTYPFKRADITTGYLFCGLVIQFISYNGLLTPGQGWFKMLGGIINETNYDVIHGAGSWDLYIGSSLLDGKYAPNMTSIYSVGATTTTQTGVGAFTTVGNASHVASFSHTHTTNISNHYHWWYQRDAAGTSAKTWSSSGTIVTFATGSKSGGALAIQLGSATGILDTGDNVNSTSTALGTTSPTSSTPSPGTLNIQPESIAMEYWIRII